MKVVADIETNALHNPTVIHCIVCKDIDSGVVYTFDPDGVKNDFKDFANRVDHWIGHNFLQFDAPVINTLVGAGTIDLEAVTDTLVLSRLFHFKLDGGHSLDSWGQRLKAPKIKFNDWSKYSQEMLTYCIQDVETNLKLYDYLRTKLIDREDHAFDEAIANEHFITRMGMEMSTNGFPFNYEEAVSLYNEITTKIKELDDEIQKDFPAKAKLVNEIVPRLTKSGSLARTNLKWWGEDLTCFTEDAPLSRIEWVPFNPSSPKQMVERLNEAGWKPIDKTKGHLEAIKTKDKERLPYFKEYGWKVNEVNLATLPDSAPNGAKKLVERIIYDSRRSTIEEWFAAYNPATGRVHGGYNHIGTWTHRMSHVRPNMGNIAAEKSLKYQQPYLANIVKDLGKRMRSLWMALPSKVLVGTDAEGIQLRIFAHYINDPLFIKAVTEGKKEDATDCHSLNKQALGEICKSRDNAKTFIYAFLLGAGIAKVAEILGTTSKLAQEAVTNFIEAYPGLEELKAKAIPKDADRGYFKGFDGRLVACDSEHHMLAGYLQNGEACIMKHALQLWYDRLKQEGIYFELVNFVHDEWQTLVNPKDAEYVGQVQSWAIKTAGEHFNLNCPMAGSYDIGHTWYETH